MTALTCGAVTTADALGGGLVGVAGGVTVLTTVFDPPTDDAAVATGPAAVADGIGSEAEAIAVAAEGVAVLAVGEAAS